MANKNLNEVLDRDIKSVKELRAAIKEYQDALVGADSESQEYKDTTDKLRVAQDELKNVTKAGREGVIQYADSIAGLEKQYREMYNAYRQFSEEYRNSAEGMAKAEELKALSEKLNNLKKDVGNYKDNIGRYAESVMDAFSKMGGSVGNLVGPFKTATQGITAFNTALKTNPIGAVITLIMTLVSIVKQLSSSIKDNEESQMRLNRAMASFQPIIDATKNAMDKVGQSIVTVVEFLGKVIDKIRVAKAAFTDFIGITKGAKDAVKEQQKVYQDLAKSVNDLTLKKREYQKANAEDKAEVERLREEASETDNLIEKKRLLQEAKDKQAEIDQRNIEIAKEELRILEEQGALTANSAEENEKLAAAVAKVSEAEAAAAANMRQFNKQLSTVGKAATSAASGMKNYREEAKKLYQESLENTKSEVQKLTEKYDKEKKLLEKYHYDTTQLTKKYNTDINKLYEEAAKTAAEKASKIYVDAAKRRISGNEFAALASELQTQLDGVLLNVRQMEAKKKEYDEFMKNFLSIDLATKEGIQQAKDFVTEINEVLGTEIQFPPKINEQSMAEFRDNLQNAEKIFELTIKRMNATAERTDLERTLANKINGEMGTLQEKIDSLRLFNPDQENQRLEYLEQITTQELEIEKRHYEKVLELENLSDEERMEARQNLYAVLEEMRARDIDLEQLNAERTANVWADAFGSFDTITNSITSIANSYKTLMNAEIQSGKLTEKEAKKKKKAMIDLEKTILAVSVAQIAASTAAGIMDVWKGYAQERANNAVAAAASTVASPAVLAALNAKSLASAILQTVGLGANAVAQIAAARGGYVSSVSNLRDDGGSASAAASVSVPTEIDSTPYTYSRTLQTAEEEDRLNQPIWVSVTDIESGLQNRVKVSDETSF